MTEQELKDFKARVQEAHYHGFAIAKADEYAHELAEEGGSLVPPEGEEALSPAHLLAMVHAVEQAHQGSAPKAPKKSPKKAEKSEAPVETKTETKVEPKVEPKVEAPKVETKPEPTKEPEAPKTEAHGESDFSALLTDMAGDKK